MNCSVAPTAVNLYCRISPALHLSRYSSRLRTVRDRSAATKCPVCMLLVDLVARHLNYESSSSPPGSKHVWLRPSVDRGGYFFDVYLDGRELGAVRYVTKGYRQLYPATFGNLQIERPALSNLLKAWLNRCEETHGDTCKTSLNVSSQRYRLSSCKLILVDTIEESLVLEQPCLERRYVALSYVWGGVLAFRTTTENLQRLQGAGSLNTQNACLPQTVRDAMAVVASLGERYLWVDTLCIIQDDEKSKAIFISQMDTVYHHAFLTIVAMSGQDANGGLPGLRPFTRAPQLCTEVDGHIFLATPPGMSSSAGVSRYEQRGWTLQECILSKRCVYFSTQEVYYQCRSAVWEEPSLAQELLGTRPVFEPPTLMNPLKMSPTGSLLNAEGAYQRLVENYTRRCLTFPSDKLNAFRGILGLLGDNDRSTGKKSGVPASFWGSLLWAPVTTVTRRPTSANPGEDPLTWSWLAWDGPVNFPVRGKIDCKDSTHALHSLRIKFESRVPANSFQITGGQITDANKGAVPGNLLRDIHGQIAGVLFDFEAKFTAIWGKLCLVFHSFVREEPEPGQYDGGWRPPLKFTVGNYVRVLEESGFGSNSTLVNALVVGEIGRSGYVERFAMGQIIKEFWDSLTWERTTIDLVLLPCTDRADTSEVVTLS